MKKLKKLELKKVSVSSLKNEEMAQVNGGLFKSQMMCFGTNANTECTQHTRCGGGGSKYLQKDNGGVTIFCFD